MRHRLICCSDTHGCQPPDNRDGEPITAWLHAGDAYDGPAILGDEEEPLPGDPIAEPMRSWLRSRDKPVYGVHGNHDVADPYRWFASIEAVDGRVARIAPKLVVVGIGWNGEKYFELPGESDLRRICDAARRQVLRLTNAIGSHGAPHALPAAADWAISGEDWPGGGIRLGGYCRTRSRTSASPDCAGSRALLVWPIRPN